MLCSRVSASRACGEGRGTTRALHQLCTWGQGGPVKMWHQDGTMGGEQGPGTIW